MQRKDFQIFDNQLCRIRKKMGALDDTIWAEHLRKLFQKSATITNPLLKKIHEQLHTPSTDKVELIRAVIFELCLAVELPEKIWTTLIDFKKNSLDLSKQYFTLDQLLTLGIILEFTQAVATINFSSNHLSSYSNAHLKALAPIFKHIILLDLSNNNLAQMSEEELELLREVITSSEMLFELNIAKNHLGNLKSPEDEEKWKKIYATTSHVAKLNFKDNDLSKSQLEKLDQSTLKNVAAFFSRQLKETTNKKSRSRPTKKDIIEKSHDSPLISLTPRSV